MKHAERIDKILITAGQYSFKYTLLLICHLTLIITAFGTNKVGDLAFITFVVSFLINVGIFGLLILSFFYPSDHQNQKMGVMGTMLINIPVGILFILISVIS